MEEKIALTEETSPMVETEEEISEIAEVTEPQDTTPEEQPDEGTEETVVEEAAPEEAAEAPAWRLPVRFNHELRELSIEEAQTYAQKGMHSESVMNDLRLLAARSGMGTVNELVKSLKESAENTRRQELVNQIGGDEDLIKTILEAESKKYLDAAGIILDNENKALAAENQTAAEKFATEFISLQNEFPELNEFKDVPADVITSAMKNNISLLDAFLRFKHEENKKISKAERTEAAAKTAGTGSGKSVGSDASSPAIAAMRRGVWS